jgi:arginyl-tRNA synthetase
VSDEIKIRPMPTKYGVGFVAETPLPELGAGYRYEQAGFFHNYHVTPAAWVWPTKYSYDHTLEYVVEGFAPNLNKELHVGHVRNLAIANALQHMLPDVGPRFTALLGCSLGVKKAATDGWKWWTKHVGYRPECYYDAALPTDGVPTREMTDAELAAWQAKLEERRKAGRPVADVDGKPRVWDGPNGPVTVMRADGRPLYAFYDVVYMEEVGPTHYIVAHEQRDHFADLGVADKHLSFGHVLGPDGTKLKSRTGDALLARELMDLLREKIGIDDRTRADRVAWNIVAWNLLHATRPTNLKFEVEKWVKPDAPGMNITYTLARMCRALEKHALMYMPLNRDMWPELTEDDAKLLGTAAYFTYYKHKAVAQMDPSPLANYAHELSRAIGSAYERDRIRGGREGFVRSIEHATAVLRLCVSNLGMLEVGEV